MGHAEFVAALKRLLKVVESPEGVKAWKRLADWEDPGPVPSSTKPTPPQKGDPDYDQELAEAMTFVPGASQRREDWLEDRIVGAYRDDFAKLTGKVLIPALRRVEKIVAIANPGKAKHLASAHILKAQVGAAGCCVSCWRDDKKMVEVELKRVANGPDVPYYRDLCRFCGEWKADHDGQLPPVWLLRKRHINPRSISTADWARAESEMKGRTA